MKIKLISYSRKDNWLWQLSELKIKIDYGAEQKSIERWEGNIVGHTTEI